MSPNGSTPNLRQEGVLHNKYGHRLSVADDAYHACDLLGFTSCSFDLSGVWHGRGSEGALGSGFRVCSSNAGVIRWRGLHVAERLSVLLCRLHFQLTFTLCVLATAASPERRRLSVSTTSKPDGSSVVGHEIFNLLKTFYVMTVEVDADGPYVQVITIICHIF